MTPQERHKARYMAKRAAYLREAGKPTIITEEEAVELHGYIKTLVSRGMSGHAISREAGASQTTVNRLIRTPGGFRTLRRNYDNILKVQPPPVTSYKPREGRTMPVFPARRRLQALAADGFPHKYMASVMGIRYRNSQWYRIINGQGGEYTTPYYINVAEELYDKLAGTNPADWGLTHKQITRTQTLARKSGYAPSGCWDWDTIDNPYAFPEWTGLCGTVMGFRVHSRDSIAVCEPCRQAKCAYEEARRKREAA
jgi:hypothetical protein